MEEYIYSDEEVARELQMKVETSVDFMSIPLDLVGCDCIICPYDTI